MILNYIYLGCTFQENLPIGLALCLLPALLGWLAARTFYNVGGLRGQISSLTGTNGELNTKVSNLTAEGTDLRVKITQLESELHDRNEQVRKLKSELMICESERNIALAKGNDKGSATVKTGVTTTPAKKPAAATIVFGDKKYKVDDLKIVEGIGPKIEELCHKIGIKTWKALSEANIDTLRKMLDEAGPNFRIHDPGSWPKQAGLADKGDWDGLRKLQDELTAGR